MPSSVIQQMKLKFPFLKIKFPFLKLKFPFLNCRNSYASLCPEHCSSHSPAELPGLDQHPPNPCKHVPQGSSAPLPAISLSFVEQSKGEDREKHPTLGCSPWARHLQHPACWPDPTPGALLSQAKPGISGVNTLSGFKGRSGKCFQWRANKANLSLLKLKALGGKEGEESRLFAWSRETWDRKRRGRWWVLLCAAITPFSTWLWHFQACEVHAAGSQASLLWAEMVLLRPGCGVTGLSSHLPGPCWSPPFPPAEVIVLQWGQKGCWARVGMNL